MKGGILVLSNIIISVKRGHPIVNEDIYHPSLAFDINRADIKFLKSKKTAKYNFFNADYDGINGELHSINWTELLNTHDINVAVDIFYNEINEIIEINLIIEKNYYRRKMKKPLFVRNERRLNEKKEIA